MLKTLPFSVSGVLLSLTIFVPSGIAGPILASYSGSYSVTTTAPATDGIASLYLGLGPLFANCAAPGQCVDLARLNNLNTTDSGRSFTLTNPAAVLSALANGQADLFLLSMNFGATYSPGASGGGIAIGITNFDPPLEDAYLGQPVNSITLTLDHLLFQTVATPFGLGTEALLDFTLALNGPGILSPPSFGTTPTATTANLLVFTDPPASAPTPEPGTLATLAIGLALLMLGKR